MGIVRVEGWETILNEQLTLSQDIEFKYGVTDCTIWSANVLKSYTNLEWEPTWTNKKEAIKQHKSKLLEEQVDEVLGKDRRNPTILTTMRGDLVQKDIGKRAALGICIGGRVAFLNNKIGICYVSLKDCAYSWRI